MAYPHFQSLSMKSNSHDGIQTADTSARQGRSQTTFFSIIVVLIMLFGAAITLVTIVPAKADTGGYPYASIACVWAPYATTGTGNWCKKVNASGQIISEYDY